MAVTVESMMGLSRTDVRGYLCSIVVTAGNSTLGIVGQAFIQRSIACG